MNDGYTNIKLDIPEYVFLFLAKEAHNQGITLNEFINNILLEAKEEAIEENIAEETSTEDLEFSLKGATKDILRKGVTEETLANFGYTFTQWFEDSCGDLKCTDLFQQAFDEIDEEDQQNG